MKLISVSMSVRINEFANSSAAMMSLNKATAQTQKTLSRLSSGARIVETSDDAAGAAVSLKMAAAIRRCDATDKNLQNADSFLRTQASALDALGKGVTRLMELKTLSLDATKNASDIANYSAEFSQVRQSLITISNMKFNGIDLFSHTGADTYLNPVSDENGRQQVRLTQYALGGGATDWLSDIPNFSFVPGTFSWEEAKIDAERRGGHLATITSAKEQDDVEAQLGANFQKDAWLGARNTGSDGKSPPGTWSWITGEPIDFNSWNPGEPNGSPIWKELYMHGAGRGWDDVGNFNTWPVGYILERPARHLSTIQGGALDTTLQYISNCLAQNGAEATAVGVSNDNIRAKSVSMQSAKSKIADTDVAQETQNLSKAQILTQIGSMMIKQSSDAQKVMLQLIDKQ